MKFLCPNCKAKYRIGPEKMVGRQAAKIRCRKCDYLIQIAYRNDSDEFDVTATPPSAPPPAAASRAPKPAVGQPAVAAASARPRAPLEEGIASKKPTAAVPGLPGLGSAKSTRGAALVSEAAGTSRRPFAPLPPPPVAPSVGNGLGAPPLSTSAPSLGAPSDGAARAIAPNGASSAPAAPRSVAGSTQLGDQFRESVQAGASEDLPREGWFVGVNGVPLGPIPLGDLRELAIAGHIDRRSLVWREGQAEWRPLGKFPGLARVIDDGSGPPITPLPEPSSTALSSQLPPPPSLPPPSPPVRPNGAGSHGATSAHVATGFDVARPDLSERPSAWGDLDDEDDDDEQPTTVKGRVSVMPSSIAAPVSMVPPSVPQVLPQAAPPPAPPAARGNTTSVPVFAPMAQAPVSVPAPGHGTSPAVFGGVLDVEPPPSRSRTRWYLIAAAIVIAFALGAVVTHLMRSSAAEKPAPTGGTERSSVVANPFVPPDPRGDAAERSGPSRSPPVLTSQAMPVDPTGGSAFDTAVSPPSTTPPSRAALLSVESAARAAAGRSNGNAAVSSERGLDAKTVQRTVQRYSPAVRQSCWRRALGARAPGVPASAKVTASITVESTGRVQAVSVSGAPRGYAGLARCIEGIVRGWRFPRATARTITSVPFMFLGK